MNPYLSMMRNSGATGKGIPKAAAGLSYIDKRTKEPVNLPKFGGTKRSGTKKLSADDQVFTDDGVVQADGTRDALIQIKHVLDSWAEGSIDPMPVMASADEGMNLTASERDALILEALQDPRSEGFEVLGQQLINPVKEVLDYEGFARRCLPIRLVRQGETVRYDKDVFSVAYEIGRDAQTPETRLGGRYVFPAPRDVTEFVTIEMRDIFQAAYDILSRIQNRSRQAIEKKEDDIFRAQLDAAATAANDITYFAGLNLGAIEAVRYQVEKWRIPADKLLINRQEVSDLVTILSTEVDPVMQRELILGGFVGMVANMAVITSAGRNTFEVIQPGEVFCTTAPEFLGGFPIWVELFSEPVNQFNQGKPVRGWFWYELISQVIINKPGVSKGIKVS